MKTQAFVTTELLTKCRTFSLSRGIHSETKETILIKIAETPAAIQNFKNEIDVLSQNDIGGETKIIHSDLNGTKPFILYKNVVGSILAEKISAISEYPLPKICDVFLNLSHCVQLIHNQNIIHNGISPFNFIYNESNNKSSIIDFGGSSEYNFKLRDQFSPYDHLPNLLYIAPEQTGRINRSIDHRSDLYSLGIIFYEILSGHPPFRSEEPIEIIHSHISRMPEKIEGKNEELVSVILKLIAKNPENRYQSTQGLIHDLSRIQSNQGHFKIALKDFSSRLNINETLYGRSEEKALLLQLLKDTYESTNHSNFLLILGGAGQGKSALIDEILNDTIIQKGYFLKGKHDQILKNIPYSSISQILKKYISIVISQKFEIQEYSKKKILEELGDNIGVITQLVPEIELLVGKQKIPPSLEGQEAQNRFHAIFRTLLKTLSELSKPLVIVIDDFQWADAATIQLLSSLTFEKSIPGLFLILSSRFKEEYDSSFLFNFLDHLEGLSYINKITITDLSKSDIHLLLEDSIGTETEDFDALLEFLFNTANGNPLFTKELLNELKHYNSLYFDFKKEKWCFDASVISKISISSNIIETIQFRLRSLSPGTLELLKFASCEGISFDLNCFQNFNNFRIEELIVFAEEASKAGIIFPVEKISQNTRYSFYHDRFLQSTYNLTSEKERMVYNLHLAKYYKANYGESKIIGICNFYQNASELIIEQQEIIDLIIDHFKAIQIARKHVAYDLGLSLAKTAVAHFDRLKTYDENLKFSIMEEYGWLLYATGNFDDGEKVYLELINNCQDLKAFARLNIVRIGSLASRSRIFDSVNLGLEVINKLGVFIPTSEEERGALFMTEYGKILNYLETHKPNDLLLLPKMDDEIQILVQQILSRLLIPTILSAQITLLGVLTCISITLVIKHGAIDLVAYAYALFAVTIISIQKDYKTGVEFGEIALEASLWNQNKSLMGGVYNTVGCITNHLKYPASDNERLFKLSSKFCEESGNIFERVLSEGNSLWNHFYRGANVHDIYTSIANFENICKKYNVWDAMLNIYFPTMAMLKFLTGENEPSDLLHYSGRTELEHVEIVEKLGSKSPLAQFYGILITKSFLFGKYEEILKSGELLEKNTAAPTVYHDICPNFYRCVSYILVLNTLGEEQKIYYQNKIQNLKSEFKIFSELNPDNFLHMYLLILAVESAEDNKNWEAMGLFDESINSAKENGYIQNAALAYEIASKFYNRNNRIKIADNYKFEAYKLYNHWGAEVKIKSMDQEDPNLKLLYKSYVLGRSNYSSQISSNSELQMDYLSMIKTANILLTEVRTDQLIEKIIKIILENSGANEATLIVNQSGQPFIHTYGCVTEKVEIEFINKPIQKFENISQNILNYVLNSKNQVLLDKAYTNPEYISNPYIANKKVQSLLCKPIIHKTEVIGAIYLENNFISGAFSPDRTEIINLISTFAGISLENSLLYQELDNKVKVRTFELNQTNEKLVETNSLLNQTLDNLKSTQEQLIMSEKMVVLGRLISGIAHEINTPLAAIVASNQLTLELTSENTLDILETYSNFDPKAKEIWKILFEHRKQNILFRSASAFRETKQEISEILKNHNLPAGDFFVDTLTELGVNKENIFEIIQYLNLPNIESILENLISISTILNSGAIIKNAAERATKVIKALKNYVYESQTESLSEIILSKQIEMCLVLYQTKIKSKFEINTDFSEIIPIMGYADQLNQVWINLINNAFYAVKQEGKLNIRTFYTDEYLAISFQDNGIGIPVEIHSKIFNPFFTTKSAEDGSGLGLDICKKIIERHNGKIEFQSIPGNTCFTVYLSRNLKPNSV